jgi:hypothetical protein
MRLKYRRQGEGSFAAYFAYDETRQYAIVRHDARRSNAGWTLRIRTSVETCGVKHAIDQPTLHTYITRTRADARDVAQRYHDLGDDYQPSEHGYASRFTFAVQAHDTATTAKLRAEVDALRAEVNSNRS